MRTSTAYFAGAGTVMAAIVIGFGGSLLFANIVSPTAPKPEMTKLDQRMSRQPIQVTTAPSETVSKVATAPNENAAPAPAAPANTAQVQASTANPVAPTPPPAAVPDVTTATSSQPAAAARPAAAPPPPQPVVAATQAAQQEPRAAPAREEPSAADVKRSAEKRKVDRRQQWAEKRRYQQQDSQRRQDMELRAVEEAVREETVPRRELAAEPVRSEMPVIRLFGME